jgi:hypothetical protein
MDIRDAVVVVEKLVFAQNHDVVVDVDVVDDPCYSCSSFFFF